MPNLLVQVASQVFQSGIETLQRQFSVRGDRRRHAQECLNGFEVYGVCDATALEAFFSERTLAVVSHGHDPQLVSMCVNMNARNYAFTHRTAGN